MDVLEEDDSAGVQPEINGGRLAVAATKTKIYITSY